MSNYALTLLAHRAWHRLMVQAATGCVLAMAPRPATAQDRWFVHFRDRFGTTAIDTTRIVMSRPGVWRLWQRTDSGNMSLTELDCTYFRVRLIQMPSYDRITDSRTVITAPDTITWNDLAPDSRGEAGARAACAFLKTRSSQRRGERRFLSATSS